MTSQNNTPPPLPWSQAHSCPSAAERDRILRFNPYVREAQETVRPAWHLKSRCLLDYLLINVLDGEGVFTINGQELTVTGGDLIWIPSGVAHEMRGTGPAMHLQFIHFDLDYDPARSHWSAKLPGGTEDLTPWANLRHPPVADPELASWCGKLVCDSPAIVTETLRRIILEYSRAEVSGLLVSGLVQQLLALLLQNSRERTGALAVHARALDAAMQEIRLRCRDKLNLSRLASQFGLSPSHFRKLFHEQFGESPRAVYLGAKLRLACDYLAYTQMSVSEIADGLGFSTVQNFSRAFSSAIGVSPSAYRSGERAQAPKR